RLPFYTLYLHDALPIFCPPEALISRSLAITSRSRSSQVMRALPFLGPLSRALSYSESTEASTCALVPPPVTPENVLPSIFIGRPSRVLTTMLQQSPPLMYVDA